MPVRRPTKLTMLQRPFGMQGAVLRNYTTIFDLSIIGNPAVVDLFRKCSYAAPATRRGGPRTGKPRRNLIRVRARRSVAGESADATAGCRFGHAWSRKYPLTASTAVSFRSTYNTKPMPLCGRVRRRLLSANPRRHSICLRRWMTIPRTYNYRCGAVHQPIKKRRKLCASPYPYAGREVPWRSHGEHRTHS
jgi:hypothetical protein